jgi:hypothetical protein
MRTPSNRGTDGAQFDATVPFLQPALKRPVSAPGPDDGKIASGGDRNGGQVRPVTAQVSFQATIDVPEAREA